MFKDKSVLAVVPARGGSKGIPKKNLRRLLGRSLIGMAGDVVQALLWVDRAIISTDDPAMAREGRGPRPGGPVSPARGVGGGHGHRQGRLEARLPLCRGPLRHAFRHIHLHGADQPLPHARGRGADRDGPGGRRAHGGRDRVQDARLVHPRTRP